MIRSIIESGPPNHNRGVRTSTLARSTAPADEREGYRSFAVSCDEPRHVATVRIPGSDDDLRGDHYNRLPPTAPRVKPVCGVKKADRPLPPPPDLRPACVYCGARFEPIPDRPKHCGVVCSVRDYNQQHPKKP